MMHETISNERRRKIVPRSRYLAMSLDLYDLLEDILTPDEHSSPKAANKQHVLSISNVRDPKSGRTPLHEASMQEEDGCSACSTIDQLIRDGANVNKTTFLGRNTALHLASEYDNVSAVGALLAHQETNPNSRNKYKETPLHLAQSVAVADLLITSGASLDAKNSNHHTPLEAMCKREEESGDKKQRKLIQHLTQMVEKRTRAEIRRELDANRERRRRVEAIKTEQKRFEEEEKNRRFNTSLISQYRRWRRGT